MLVIKVFGGLISLLKGYLFGLTKESEIHDLRGLKLTNPLKYLLCDTRCHQLGLVGLLGHDEGIYWLSLVGEGKSRTDQLAAAYNTSWST